jgi:hypothetical protein
MKQGHLNFFGNYRQLFTKGITSVLIISFLAATTQAQSLIPELSFRNPVLKTGKGCTGDGLDGAVYIFENVGWNVDAMVTILGRSSAAVSLSTMDMPGLEQDSLHGTGADNAWQPRIKYGNGQAPADKVWWMEFRVLFVKHFDRKTPLAVNQFFVSGFDIDGDGNQLHEFQSFYNMHFFSLEPQTAIFASSIRGSQSDPLVLGKRFDGPTTNYPGISTNASDAQVSSFYTNTPSVIIRLGAQTGHTGSVQTDRMYGLLFKSLAFDVPIGKPSQPNWVASGENH